MAIKPETAFIQTIHRRLKQHPNPPLIKKLADRFTNGLPDVLYIGPSGTSLWVEYKVHPNQATTLQRHTLETLMTYRQRIAIITKTPHSTKIYDGTNEYDNNEPWCWILNQLGYNHATATETIPPAAFLNIVTGIIPKENT